MKEPRTSLASVGGGEKPALFVVDDEPMLLELATVVLEAAGFHVRTFRDAEAAVGALKSSTPRPALIITDYAMHNMNGMEFVRECRRLDPRQKILLVSGTVDESIYRDSMVKPDCFLAKPYHAAQLTEAVRALVEA
jgi:DNA-binding response OmpR family regulator